MKKDTKPVGARWGKCMKRRAFTLIELLVVIAIILILMGISMKLMSIVNNKTGSAKTIYVLEQTRNALDAYYSGMGVYPNVSTIPYDRFNGGGKENWKVDISSQISNKYGLVYFIGYETSPRAASWQKFVVNVSPPVIVDTLMYLKTNSPVGFDKIIYTNEIDSILDAWGNEVIYAPNATSEGYSLYSAGPDGVPGTADDIGITKNE